MHTREQDRPRHMDLKLFSKNLLSKAYSLKPGFTETRLRPLARRRDKTFWPPWVFMRVRNPCFFDRLRRLGWNVRLGMKSSHSYEIDGRKANNKYK
jgi:hypothetical protein